MEVILGRAVSTASPYKNMVTQTHTQMSNSQENLASTEHDQAFVANNRLKNEPFVHPIQFFNKAKLKNLQAKLIQEAKIQDTCFQQRIRSASVFASLQQSTEL